MDESMSCKMYLCPVKSWKRLDQFFELLDEGVISKSTRSQIVRSSGIKPSTLILSHFNSHFA